MASYTKSNNPGLSALSQRIRPQRGLVFGVMIVGALLAFELFNFSTTDFALGDLLGQNSFLGARWSTILALAFCGIDFAGIARLFTPEQGADEPQEVWYLFGAWLLAATMNAMLTWWGVSIAILDHQTLGNAVVDRTMLLKVVPIFVAIMVWLSRVLIIGTFSVAGDRLFSQDSNKKAGLPRSQSNFKPRPALQKPVPQSQYRKPVPQASFRPSPKPRISYGSNESMFTESNQPEPTYHPISMRSNKPTSKQYK